MIIQVNAEYICTFENFEQWVAKAASWLGNGQYMQGTVFCLDSAGNFCEIGEDFMRASDKGLFPVKAYRMIRTIEVKPPYNCPVEGVNLSCAFPNCECKFKL